MATTIPVIKQGESADFTVALIDQAGNQILVDDAVGIEAETRVGGIISRKYTDDSPLPDDYYTITKIATNKISIYVSRTDSVNFDPQSKQVILNVLVKMPEGSTPLYYNLQYVIATTATGTLLNSSL